LAEATIEVGATAANALGDRTTSKNLHQAKDRISSAADEVGSEIAEAGGKILTAANTAKVAAAYFGGPAALSVVQAAQGETVTLKTVEVNVAAAGVTDLVPEVGSQVGNAALQGAVRGASRGVLETVTNDDPKQRLNFDASKLGEDALTGAHLVLSLQRFRKVRTVFSKAL